MKYRSAFALCFLFILSCKNDSKLTFETKHMVGQTCESCPKVQINIPSVIEKTKIGETIDNILQEEIIYLLTFDEEIDATTIDEAIASFNSGYEELKTLYPDESVGWEAKIEAKISFENENVLTILMDSYVFSGGAHGYNAIRYLNFDKKKGIELETWQLFKNAPDFEKFAESKFKAQENIPTNQAINSTGFMFENDTFYLPENIGFTENGLQLLYNQYEVASYADGPIKLTLPFEEVSAFLAYKVKD
ncbi:MAG: DUF3298 domain-containing protein [Flavobacteriaceae bacterium]